MKYYDKGQLILKKSENMSKTLNFKEGIRIIYTKEGDDYRVDYYHKDDYKYARFSIDPNGVNVETSILLKSVGPVTNDETLDRPFYRIAALMDLRIASGFFFEE
jgi:hypothetical protein